MLTIGLTGGYATGKSTVSAFLRSLGATVADADELSHAALLRGGAAWGEVLAAFGPGILGRDGEIDRQALGRIVFAAPELRERLERIVHPKVIAAMRAAREEARAAGQSVFVCEAPLLFETGLEREFDQVWVVSAGANRQRELAKARNALSDEDLQVRLAAQMPLAEKERRATLVLRNDGSFADLQRQVLAAWEGLPR